jgi:cytochrome c biogenesis protein CcdA
MEKTVAAGIDNGEQKRILASAMKKLLLCIVLAAFTFGIALPLEAAPLAARPFAAAKAKAKKKKKHHKKKKKRDKRKL